MNTVASKSPPWWHLPRRILRVTFFSILGLALLGAIVEKLGLGKDTTPIDPQTSRDIHIMLSGMHAARERGWDVNFNGLYLDVTVKSRDPAYADAFAEGLCNGGIHGVTPGKYEVRVYLIDGSLSSQCTIR